jgi:hypothetical protein
VTQTDDQRAKQVNQVIMCCRSLAQLAELAVLRRGFGNSDVGFGVVYPREAHELDGDYIPPGLVQIYGGWGKAFEFVIEERTYLAILAKTLRAKGLAIEAAQVEGLIA